MLTNLERDVFTLLVNVAGYQPDDDRYSRFVEAVANAMSSRRYDPSTPFAWFYGIVADVRRRYHKAAESERRYRRRHVQLNHDVADDRDVVDLSDLPADDRRLLDARYVERRTWQEIGDELGMTATGASERFRRLRQRIRRGAA